MFLFESIPWYSAVMWVAVVAALMLLNEDARASRWVSLALFVAVPLILTVLVWPTTAGAGSSTGTWFHRVKVCSALAGCLGSMALRVVPGLIRNRYAPMFPAAVLAINILEAVISCTIPASFIKRGAWLQHRAQTLAFWMMLTMAVPSFVTDSRFSVASCHDTTALLTVSAPSLAANVAVAVYQVHRIVTKRRNPPTDELSVELSAYQKVVEANRPANSRPVPARSAQSVGAGGGAPSTAD